MHSQAAIIGFFHSWILGWLMRRALRLSSLLFRSSESTCYHSRTSFGSSIASWIIHPPSSSSTGLALTRSPGPVFPTRTPCTFSSISCTTPFPPLLLPFARVFLLRPLRPFSTTPPSPHCPPFLRLRAARSFFSSFSCWVPSCSPSFSLSAWLPLLCKLRQLCRLCRLCLLLGHRWEFLAHDREEVSIMT